MRLAVFLLAALQIAGFLFLAQTAVGGSDPAGNAMSTAFLGIAGMIMAVLLIPALILAITNRGLKAALALAVLAGVAAIAFLAWI